MNVKVIIANNNDILYSNLSNLVLQHESKIEIIKVPLDKLYSVIYRIKSKDNLIIIDSITSISFCSNIIRNAINRIGNEKNIIILVLDSERLVNVVNQEKTQTFFKKNNSTIISILDIINIVSEAMKETFELEKEVDNILWGLGFTSYFKGATYLKDAILMVYNDKELLKDVNFLVEKIAEKNNAYNQSVVRSVMDKTLNSVLDLIDNSVIYNIFGDFYDGRKISLKYFIDLCIHYLNEKNYCCLNEKRTIHS